MTRERHESYLWIPGSGRDVEAFAWKPTAWVETAEGHPHAPPVRNRGGKGTTPSSLGCPPASRGIQTCRQYVLGGPYSLPLTEKREDSVQWEEEKLLSHNLGLKIQSWGCTCSVYTAAVSRAHAMVRSPSVTMTASWTASSTLLTWVPSSTTASWACKTLHKGCSGSACHWIQKSGKQKGQKSGLKGHHQTTPLETS